MNMNVHLLHQGTGTGAKPSIEINKINRSLRNANNIGVVQVIGAGNTVTIQGSCDGTNFMDLASGATSTLGKTVSLMPWMRVNVVTASGTVTCYLCF